MNKRIYPTHTTNPDSRESLLVSVAGAPGYSPVGGSLAGVPEPEPALLGVLRYFQERFSIVLRAFV